MTLRVKRRYKNKVKTLKIKENKFVEFKNGNRK